MLAACKFIRKVFSGCSLTQNYFANRKDLLPSRNNLLSMRPEKVFFAEKCEVVMTYISRKTRLLLPRWPDECDPDYLIQRRRSDGRLKRHNSCDDLRAWVADNYLNYQYFLELITDGEFQGRQFSGVTGRIIPVEVLLDLLCSNGDNFYDDEDLADRIGKFDPCGNDLNGSGMVSSEITPEDILWVTNAAVSKLENIRNIIRDGSSKDFTRNRDSESFNEQSRTNIEEENRKEYLSEYNSALRKISCLKQRLKAIHQKREELNNKLESSCRAVSVSSSCAAVTEFPNIERQTYIKCLQERIEKLINEKTQVLNEMCEALNYVNNLKKKFDNRRRLSRSKNENKSCSACGCRISQVETFRKGSRERDRSGERIKRHRSSDVRCSTGESSQRNDNEIIYFNPRKQEIDSSEATFVSTSTFTDSQRTYYVNNFNLEQTLRDYKQKLIDLGCLEVQVEELKKRAAVADYFKKRWLRCSSEAQATKQDEKDKSEELKQLFMENKDLRNVIKKLEEKAEKDENEIEDLKYREVEMEDMKKKMVNLKKKLKEYQISFDDQRECIGRLEETISIQREKIENQMSQITKLCRAMENIRLERKTSKMNGKRSRSYGPECNRKGRKPSLTASSDEDNQRPSFCSCCGCCIIDKGQSRPRSES